jgi:hypothetical protein
MVPLIFVPLTIPEKVYPLLVWVKGKFLIDDPVLVTTFNEYVVGADEPDSLEFVVTI